MPPFPNPDNQDNQGSPQSSGAAPRPEDAGDATARPTSYALPDDSTAATDAPASASSVGAAEPTLTSAEADPDIDALETEFASEERLYAELPPEEDDLVDDFTRDNGPDESRGPGAAHRQGTHRSFRTLAMDELSRRTEMALLHGMERLADSFDESAHRIHRLATLRGGPDAANFGPVTSTVGRLEGAAGYLRNTDVDGVKTDLRRRVRARPVQTLGIALCVGWVAGRILR